MKGNRSIQAVTFRELAVGVLSMEDRSTVVSDSEIAIAMKRLRREVRRSRLFKYKDDNKVITYRPALVRKVRLRPPGWVSKLKLVNGSRPKMMPKGFDA